MRVRLVAISTMLFLVACGSSSHTLAPRPGGAREVPFQTIVGDRVYLKAPHVALLTAGSLSPGTTWGAPTPEGVDLRHNAVLLVSAGAGSSGSLELLHVRVAGDSIVAEVRRREPPPRLEPAQVRAVLPLTALPRGALHLQALDDTGHEIASGTTFIPPTPPVQPVAPRRADDPRLHSLVEEALGLPGGSTSARVRVNLVIPVVGGAVLMLELGPAELRPRLPALFTALLDTAGLQYVAIYSPSLAPEFTGPAVAAEASGLFVVTAAAWRAASSSTDPLAALAAGWPVDGVKRDVLLFLRGMTSPADITVTDANVSILATVGQDQPMDYRLLTVETADRLFRLHPEVQSVDLRLQGEGNWETATTTRAQFARQGTAEPVMTDYYRYFTVQPEQGAAKP